MSIFLKSLNLAAGFLVVLAKISLFIAAFGFALFAWTWWSQCDYRPDPDLKTAMIHLREAVKARPQLLEDFTKHGGKLTDFDEAVPAPKAAWDTACDRTRVVGRITQVQGDPVEGVSGAGIHVNIDDFCLVCAVPRRWVSAFAYINRCGHVWEKLISVEHGASTCRP